MSAVKITKYDKIFRKILKLERQKNGILHCARCGTGYPLEDCAGLHVSHYYSRANWSTRLDRDNCSLHCCGCHQHLGGNPHVFKDWKIKELGQERYDALVQRANSMIPDLFGMKKKQWLEVWYEDAKQELKELEDEFL